MHILCSEKGCTNRETYSERDPKWGTQRHPKWGPKRDPRWGTKRDPKWDRKWGRQREAQWGPDLYAIPFHIVFICDEGTVGSIRIDESDVISLFLILFNAWDLFTVLL